MKKPILILPFICLAIVSCGGGGGGSTPAPPPPAISVSVSPSSQTVPAGGTQQFTATVQNTSNQAVTWQVNGVSGGNATVGTISSSGLFTAPALPPAGGSATVTAVSQADSSKSGSATVTIVFSNASVNGRYAFSFSGSDAAGEFFIAGSFQADGSGNITSGIEDLNHGTGVFTNLAFTGTYSVGADGRGSATTTSSQGTSTFRFVLDGQGLAVIIAFDSDHGSGTVQKQDTSAFSSTAIAGNWSFSFGGINSSGGPAAAAGRFGLDAAGNISAGVEDFNNAGVVSSNVTFTGSTSSVSSSGRGTATFTSALGTSQLAFYVVSANEAVFVTLDFPSGFLGSAAKHQSASFSLSSLNGNYAFLLAGASTLGAVVNAGRFTADGNGNLSSGVFDENDTGVVLQNQSFTGTYSLAANGRGTAIVTSGAGSSSFALYMVSQDRAFFVETDATAVTVGAAFSQKGSPFSNSSVSGSFGFFLSGAVGTSLTDIVGKFTANGSGGLTGTEDAHIGSTLTTAASITGTYSIGPNGRGTATITVSGTTSNFVFYVVDSSTVVFVGVDPNEVLVGAAGKQF